MKIVFITTIRLKANVHNCISQRIESRYSMEEMSFKTRRMHHDGALSLFNPSFLHFLNTHFLRCNESYDKVNFQYTFAMRSH